MFHDLQYCPQEFRARCAQLPFRYRDVIVRRGSLPEYVYFVLEGFINIKYTTSKGGAVITSHFMRGDYIGDLETIDRRPFVLDAQAASDGMLLRIPAAEFVAMMRRDFRMVESMTQSQHNRITFLEAYSIITGTFSLYERAILFFAGPMRQPLVAAGCTRQYIAEYLATDVRCVNRVLNQLVANGILTHDGRGFRWDMARLSAEAEAHSIGYYVRMFSEMFVDDPAVQL